MSTVEAIQFETGKPPHTVQDALTQEAMLSISVNGAPYTVTMRSPGHEEELVRGILSGEEVYNGTSNPVFTILERDAQDAISRVNVDIPAEALGPGIAKARNLLSVSSCGMCGMQEVELPLQGESLRDRPRPEPGLLGSMFRAMQSAQDTFSRTGGSHAAAAFTLSGELLVCREDIGRHNAVDKVIGYLLMHGLLPSAAVLTVSGRVSYEIVSKCYHARIPCLAAVSAPSNMAVEYCRDKGISLFAFCRGEKVTRYTE
jgi:FdhD protein